MRRGGGGQEELVRVGGGCMVVEPACGRSDWGAGPAVRRTNLFCAWLAGRLRMVIATWAHPVVIACVDRAMRAFGGLRRWLTARHGRTSLGRRALSLTVGGHYGHGGDVVPADPESKGGSEATVRVGGGLGAPDAARRLHQLGGSRLRRCAEVHARASSEPAAAGGDAHRERQRAARGARRARGDPEGSWSSQLRRGDLLDPGER